MPPSQLLATLISITITIIIIIVHIIHNKRPLCPAAGTLECNNDLRMTTK